MDKVINEDEHRLLGMGPKRMFRNKVEPKCIVINCERIAQLAPPEKMDEVRSIFYNNVNAYLWKPINQQNKHSKIFKQLKANENITIMQTDKSNKLAIRNAIYYIEKLETCNYVKYMKCIELNKDRTIPTSIGKHRFY